MISSEFLFIPEQIIVIIINNHPLACILLSFKWGRFEGCRFEGLDFEEDISGILLLFNGTRFEGLEF